MEFMGKQLGRGNHKSFVCSLPSAAHVRKNMILQCGGVLVRAVENKDDWSHYETPEALEFARKSVLNFKIPYRSPSYRPSVRNIAP